MQHAIGHVDADHLSRGTDELRGNEHVDARARSEIEHDFTFPDPGGRHRRAAAVETIEDIPRNVADGAVVVLRRTAQFSDRSISGRTVKLAHLRSRFVHIERENAIRVQRQHRLLGQRSVGRATGDRTFTHRVQHQRRVVAGACVPARALLLAQVAHHAFRQLDADGVVRIEAEEIA